MVVRRIKDVGRGKAQVEHGDHLGLMQEPGQDDSSLNCGSSEGSERFRAHFGGRIGKTGGFIWEGWSEKFA